MKNRRWPSMLAIITATVAVVSLGLFTSASVQAAVRDPVVADILLSRFLAPGDATSRDRWSNEPWMKEESVYHFCVPPFALTC